MVHEETGLKFAPGDPVSLAAAMTRVLADRELAARLTSDARAFVGERYNWNRISQHTVDVYKRAVREYEYRPRVLRVCPPLPDEKQGMEGVG